MGRTKDPKRLVLTRDVYASLVDAYREDPGNHSAASRSVGLNWRTCKRAWDEGLNAKTGHGALQADWAVSIREVIEHEKREARVRMASSNTPTPQPVAQALAQQHVEHEDEREKVRRDAVERRTEWSGAAGRVRRNATAVLHVHNALLVELLKRQQEWLSDMQKSKLDIGSTMRMVRTIGLSVRQASEALESAQRIENLAVGSPTEILGLVPNHAATMDQDEAEEIIDRAYGVVQRMRAMRAKAGHDDERSDVEDAELVDEVALGDDGSSEAAVSP